MPWPTGPRPSPPRRRRGTGPRLVTPRIPVASVTGTNGKTTTTRLLAHICMTAGLRTGWSSTDGVVVQGEVVEPGDYSGPAGARAVLETPGVQVGILETARGGMLLRGMGVTHNDVSVVTNVSADHLGMQGIDTVDQLAEVKAIVTRVTKPQGWVVLNGEDPRVWAMRAGIRARPWVFTADAERTGGARVAGRRGARDDRARRPPHRAAARRARPTGWCAWSTSRWRCPACRTTTCSTPSRGRPRRSGSASTGRPSSRGCAPSSPTTCSTRAG